RHGPHQHVRRFRHQGCKIPETVMGRLSLWETLIRSLFRRMYQVWKLDGILNKKDRNIVSHQVPVAFLCIELHGESADIPCQVSGPLVAGYRRKTYKQRCLDSDLIEDGGTGDAFQRVCQFEIAMGSKAARMHDTL